MKAAEYISTDRRPLFERFKSEFEKVFARLHGVTQGGVAQAAVEDPSITETAGLAEESQRPAIPDIEPSIAVPASLLPPSSRFTC